MNIAENHRGSPSDAGGEGQPSLSADDCSAFGETKILGQKVLVGTCEAVAALLLSRLAGRLTTRVAFMNANLAVSFERIGGMTKHLGSFILLNDGLALDIARILMEGRPFPANLNGSDFVPIFLDRLPRGTRVFLYGARATVTARVATLLEQKGLIICGAHAGYGNEPQEVMRTAVAANPDVVLVALGNPRQELWIKQYPDGPGGLILIGVGAYFDFAVNEVPRAPPIVRRLRMEWIFRCMLEPRRLARRYTLDMVEFFWRLILSRLKRNTGAI